MPVTAIRRGSTFRPGQEIIDAANAVETFHAGGRIASRLPPPAALAVSAVMGGGDFSQFQRVEDQADVSMPREPDAVRLVGRLVARPALVQMSAHIEHCRQAPARRRIVGTVEVARHVEARAALIVEHLDRVAVAFQFAGDRGGKRRCFRHRPQSEHVEILVLILRPKLFPLLGGAEAVKQRGVHLLGLAGKIGLDHAVARGGAVGRKIVLPAGRRGSARKPCQEDRGEATV